MHYQGFIFGIMLLAMNIGCENTSMRDRLVTAQAPVSTGYVLSTQPKMQAMQHWDSLAEKIAKNTSQALNHFLPNQTVPVYIVPGEDTAFAKSFRESLLTYLVGYGVPVTLVPDQAVTLETTIEFVNHRRTLARNNQGLRSSLEPGFRQTKDEKGKYLRAPIVGEESGYFDAQTPNSEVQINTSLMHQGGFLYRDSSYFYVDMADWQQYRQQMDHDPRGLKRFTIVGN
ncbi:MAG: hypothetical protein GX043_06660 [Desulfovibrionales bacterium]|nr:hypothetical protein [Desulfovibrionales bacterium]